MERKTRYIIITLCCIIGIILGTTTAWYTWTSSENTDVTFTIGGITINYVAGDNVTGQNLRPTSSKEIGVTNNYAIKKDITVSSNKTAYLSLYLTANELPTELRHESLKWELYENIDDNEILLSSGNFKDVSEEDRILLVGNTKTDDYTRDLTLYIYIDGNIDNPVEMGGQTFNFTLNAEATDEKGEYTINIPHTRISDSTPGVLSGSGTEEEPYLIESIEDLITLSNNVNSGTTYEGKYISLKQTLDFNSDESYVDNTNTTLFGDYNGDGTITSIKEEVTTGQGFIPIGLGTYSTDGTSRSGYPFKGTFLGNNNVVKNLYINYDSSSNYDTEVIGLFGYIFSAEIKKLSVTGDIYVYSQIYEHIVAGGISGYMISSKITNCNNYVNLTAKNSKESSEIVSVKVGGISRFMIEDSVVINCVNHESVKLKCTSSDRCTVGGIVSDVRSKTILNNYNYGSLTFKDEETIDLLVGGIVGYNGYYDGVITKCNNYGDIEVAKEGTLDNSTYIGGVIGYNYLTGEIIESINYGRIGIDSSYDKIMVGGISGVNHGKIEKCVNHKSGDINVKGTNEYIHVGGIVGQHTNSSNTGVAVISSYNIGNITISLPSATRIGGISGHTGHEAIINNSYNVGKIIDNIGQTNKGGITGYVKNQATITNSYYLNNLEALYGNTDGSAITITNSTSKTESEMKDNDDFVNLLNQGSLGAIWKRDTNGINGGYPILDFQE